MKKHLIAGLLVWLPIWATVVVVRFLINFLDSAWSMIPAHLHPDQVIGHHIPGLAILVTLLLLIITGALATNYFGKKVVEGWENLLSRIPLIRSIYGLFKQVSQAVFMPNSNAFKQAVMIEYPRKGIWSIGFQTSGHFENAPNNEPNVTVFVPTTPNPTSGFFMIVPKSDVTELNIPVESALKMIISLGVINPSNPPHDGKQNISAT